MPTPSMQSSVSFFKGYANHEVKDTPIWKPSWRSRSRNTDANPPSMQFFVSFC